MTAGTIWLAVPRGDFVDRDGLMSYGPDQTEPYRRLASMVDKILKGAFNICPALVIPPATSAQSASASSSGADWNGRTR